MAIHQDEQLHSVAPVEPTKAGPKGQQADKSRKRATHACDRCRARKIRCDVTLSGPPCINCHIAGEDCDLSWSKRGRHHWLARSHRLGKPLSEIASKKPPSRWKPSGTQELRRTPDITVASGKVTAKARAKVAPSADSDEWDSLPVLTPATKVSEEPHTKSADEKPGNGSFGSLPFSSLLPGGTRQHLTAGAESPRFDNERDGPGGVIGYSFYPFIGIGNLASIHQRDFQYLDQEGCLHLPTPWILNDFVAQYFLQLHPFLPIIDEGDFWQAYLCRRADTLCDKKIPLLLFQAMLYASCSFVPGVVLHKLGLGDTRAVQSALYRRAKRLFDLDTETSAVVNSRAALLLASWSFCCEAPARPVVPWLSIAIHYARVAQAHDHGKWDDEPFSSSKHPTSTALKRLWWGCFIRDRLYSLGMRQPIQITPAHFNARQGAVLCKHDLRGELDRSFVYDHATKSRLGEVLALLVKLCIVLTDILDLAFPAGPGVLPPSGASQEMMIANRVRQYQCALDDWYRVMSTQLPQVGASPAATTDRSSNSVALYVNILYIYYYAAKETLARYMLKHHADRASITSGSLLDRPAPGYLHVMVKDAAVGITDCLENLLHLRLIKRLPMSAVACTALPLLLHLLHAETHTASNIGPEHLKLARRRLEVLQTALSISSCQYDSVEWITGVINQAVALARTSNTGCEKRLAKSPAFTAECYLRLASTVEEAMRTGRVPEMPSLPEHMPDAHIKALSHSPDDAHFTFTGHKGETLTEETSIAPQNTPVTVGGPGFETNTTGSPELSTEMLEAPSGGESSNLWPDEPPPGPHECCPGSRVPGQVGERSVPGIVQLPGDAMYEEMLHLDRFTSYEVELMALLGSSG